MIDVDKNLEQFGKMSFDQKLAKLTAIFEILKDAHPFFAQAYKVVSQPNPVIWDMTLEFFYSTTMNMLKEFQDKKGLQNEKESDLLVLHMQKIHNLVLVEQNVASDVLKQLN